MSEPKPIIAEVCFSGSWGGLEHYCGDSVIRLSEMGYRVIPVVSPGSPLAKYIQANNIEPALLNAHRYFSPLATARLSQIFRKNRIDAVHLHRTHDLGVALPAADFAGVKNRVFTLQMESDRKKKDIYHRWIYNRLTRVLTITERMKHLVTDNVAVAPRKVKCLYYGLDLHKLRNQMEPRESILKRWNIAPGSFVIGIVGRLECINKGQDIVLEAAGKLAERISNLAVLIVGEESVGQEGELAALKLRADSLKGKVKVVFTGYQSPPGSIVPAFDVSILASLKESFGLVVIEAQALGVPVIGTNAGGVPEIIEDSFNGLLVPPRDSNALAEAIEKLYVDQELRIKIAENGYKNADDRFSLERHMQGLESALTEGINTH